MKEITLAFDTSNYTTSCAVFDGVSGKNAGRLLDVTQGQLGLRQSDALFSHVKHLPSVIKRLAPEGRIIAVGASSRPRETEGSYMPCFLAGTSQAKVLSEVLSLPYFEFSHQQGHIAAAAWSSGRMDFWRRLICLTCRRTTELLVVRPDGASVACEIIGGTTDISAGQLVDRTGQLLGLSFPAGKELDKLAAMSDRKKFYEMKISSLYFSLSGAEHKVKQLAAAGEKPADVAYYALASVVSPVSRVTEKAMETYGDIPVLYSGGVAANSILRALTPEGIFAEPQYSADNAMARPSDVSGGESIWTVKSSA
jgi:N6-L-threonylcarbamoyladenine synthase